MSSIAVIDDDRALCRSLEIQLESLGHEVRSAGSCREGEGLVDGWGPDLVLLDLMLPDGSGLDLLRRLRERRPEVPVVMITGRQDMEATIAAVRAGAFDYVRKPFELEDVLLVLEKMGTREGSGTARVRIEPVSDRPYEIVGADRKIVEVLKQIAVLSQSRVTVLVEGETGTGKELAARAIHQATDPAKPFVGVNCSAVVSTLSESELFGHEKGAFTGADSRKTGKLEFADEGTVFFDEIGDMSAELQGKILRVLQERRFERVGGLEGIPFGARVIAATNRDLESLVREERFRRDLYHRLAVARIALPPLRERREDIALLTRHLLDRIGSDLHRRVEAIEEEAMTHLIAYDWPGNVRELENVLTRAVALSGSSVLTAEDIGSALGSGGEEREAGGPVRPLAEVERDHIEKALRSTGWNITRTAGLLGISPTTLRKKIRDSGLRA